MSGIDGFPGTSTCSKCGDLFEFCGCIVPSLCGKCSQAKESITASLPLLKRLHSLGVDGLATITCKRDYGCKVVSFCEDRGYVEHQGLSLILTSLGGSMLLQGE